MAIVPHQHDPDQIRWPDTTNHENPVVKSGTAEFEELEREVCKAYADCNDRFSDFNTLEERDLSYEAKCRLHPADYMSIMRQALDDSGGGYNNFDAEAVGKFLFFFPGITVEPCRMGSVGLYIYGPPGVLGAIFSQLNEQVKKRQDPKRFRRTMACRLPDTNTPDEIGREEDGRLRLWWD